MVGHTLFDIKRKTDFNRVITWKQDGEPIDLTDQTILWTIKQRAGGESDDSDALVKGELDNDDHLDQAEPDTKGKTLLSLSQSDTDIKPGQYIMDFIRKDSTGSVVGVSKRTVTVSETVTQRR